MNTRPVHENLDTSFVNLAALLRFLQKRQFVGELRLELNGYQAFITISAEGLLDVRESDHIADRTARGEEALQRILIRAREPGGIIHVYQAITEIADLADYKPFVARPPEYTNANLPNGAHVNGHSNGTNGKLKISGSSAAPAEDKTEDHRPLNPFDFSNKVEERAKEKFKKIPAEEWRSLMQITAELLLAIDRALAENGLDFAAAFEKARAEIAADYPCLAPKTGLFAYRSGQVIMREQINPKTFTAGINEALSRIMARLASKPKFTNSHRAAKEKILELINKRRILYDKYAITAALNRIMQL
jgi:hypothetical protein